MRCIHSKSSLIPSCVMFPFIQCHHTRGLALAGGFANPLLSESDGLWATDQTVPSNSAILAQISLLDWRFNIVFSHPNLLMFTFMAR